MVSSTVVNNDVSAALRVTNDNRPLVLPSRDAADATLDILVEGMGRTNYGHALVDRKGILESVSLSGVGALTGWRVHLLPMTDRYVRSLTPKVTDPDRPGQFFRCRPSLPHPADTYLDLSGWTKGVVWVNGHNLGRYWQLGPQHRLYCPAEWLHAGRNDIVVFDLHQTIPAPIAFAATLG